MQIPDEVSRAAGGLRWEDALQYVAEWARKEALREAAAVVKPAPLPPGFAGGWAPTEGRRAFDEAARRIRALGED